MKLHPALAYIFWPAITAGLAIWLAIEHQARLGLAGEHQALEQQLVKMAELIARNADLSKRIAQANEPKPLPPDQLSELLRLRGQVGVLRLQQPDRDRAREENRQIHAVLENYLQTLTETNAQAMTNYWPQQAWTNTGHGSPEAALQTLLWAGYNGDLTNFVASVDEDARTNLIDEFKGKSATETSIQLADEMYDTKSVQVLSREVLDENTVVLTVEIEDQNDFNTVNLLWKRTRGEWKFAGPPP
jgi:hypothetical protein